MRKLVLWLLSLAFSVGCVAQKTRVGVVNSDSVLFTVQAYRDYHNAKMDAMERLEERAMRYQTQYLQKQQAMDSLANRESAEQQKLRKAEIDQLEVNYRKFIELSQDSTRISDSILTAPFYADLRRAEYIAAEKNTCFGVCEYSEIAGHETPKGIVYVNINRDVAAELRAASPLGAPKRVGYCNYDSLLRLTPGYQAAVDSCSRYNNGLDSLLVLFDREIVTKQKQCDSLRGSSSALINELREKQIVDMKENREAFIEMARIEKQHADSSIMFEVRQRLNVVIWNASRQNNCTITYDKPIAYTIWKPKDAEFVDLDSSIAKNLIK